MTSTAPPSLKVTDRLTIGTSKGGGASAPPYPFVHSGAVLVCGSAWTLMDDWEKGRGFFPTAPTIAVNGAAEHIPADFLYTQHPLKMPRWASYQRQRSTRFTTHASGSGHLQTNIGADATLHGVDYWWDGVASGGSSVWGARRLAAALGFDTVVLCGAPLEPGVYASGMAGKANTPAAMGRYRSEILRDTEYHSGVVSLSGWTREVFGAPCGS